MVLVGAYRTAIPSVPAPVFAGSVDDGFDFYRLQRRDDFFSYGVWFDGFINLEPAMAKSLLIFDRYLCGSGFDL